MIIGIQHRPKAPNYLRILLEKSQRSLNMWVRPADVTVLSVNVESCKFLYRCFFKDTHCAPAVTRITVLLYFISCIVGDVVIDILLLFPV